MRERIEAAIGRIKNGQAPMRIPVDQTDPDVVLADCGTRIDGLEAERDALREENARLKQRNKRQRSILEGCPHCILAVLEDDEDWPLQKLERENAALRERVRVLEEALRKVPDLLQEPLNEMVRACLADKPHDHARQRAFLALTVEAEALLAEPAPEKEGAK